MIKFPLLTILLFVFGSAFAQTQTEKEVKDLICGKWQLTHMEMGGQKVPVPPEFAETYLEMKADGTLIEIDPSKEQKGKWSYDHKTKTLITNDEDGEKKHELIKISDTELIIKSDLDGMMVNLIMKKAK